MINIPKFHNLDYSLLKLFSGHKSQTLKNPDCRYYVGIAHTLALYILMHRKQTFAKGQTAFFERILGA